MPTPSERLETEKAEFQSLVEEYNSVATGQQEKLQVITKKQARIELLEEQVAEGG
jgi:hypothetical protein